jgi:lysine-N-methylase
VRTYGFRYLTEFHCIGAECEDNCCTGWGIHVDKEHFERIEQALTQTEEGRAELARAFEPERRFEDPQRFALVVLTEKRDCSLLGADKLCTLQQRFGEEVLGDVCAIFPRSAAALGKGEGTRFELSATVSCPEVARRCLLSGDATDIVELPTDRIARGLLFRTVRGDEDVYRSSFEPVRNLLLSILSRRHVPVASRMFAIAWFSEQTLAFLHKDAQRADREAIGRLFQLLSQPEALDRFHQELSAAQLNQPFPASVVLQVMVAAREDPSARLLRLIDAAIDLDGADPAKLLANHRQRTAALSPQARDVLELALEGYAKNAVFKEWYVLTPSFARWLQHLVIRMALIRYLFATHARREEDPKAAVVDVVYSLSRTFEHGDKSIGEMIDDLTSQGMTTLGHAIALLTF